MSLFTIREAADHTGTTPRTIQRWLASGLRHTRRQGRIYIHIADLNQREMETRRHGGRLRKWQQEQPMS